MTNVGGLVEEDEWFLGGFGSLSMKRFGLNPNPGPLKVNEDCLAEAEEAAKEVLKCIHPTLDSEERRNDVIDFIQTLMNEYLGCQVLPYGSVPLKTYLPDGDIDFTAIQPHLTDDNLPKAVFAVLKEEQLYRNGKYKVKDIEFIDAEVKLVKCLVQDIMIDISFNQIGGLCTLCFLEQVDRLVGNDHLFKRSILLVKTWCYYESRILGSHHGLISTYALETLVLYIFHLFHSSLTSPLAVLHRFLDYYSKFDWSKLCISLNGPVSKSTLPDIVVEKLDNEGKKFLLSEDFLKECMDMFSESSSDDAQKTFPPKYLNIIDPLKEYNNLGRSVHRGNFYRIQSALRYGARKLSWILSLPKGRVTDEIKTFFVNTLERHGCKNECYLSKCIHAEGSIDFSVSPSGNLVFEDEMLLRSSLCSFEDDSARTEEKCSSHIGGSEPCKYPRSMVLSQTLSESYSADGVTTCPENFVDDNYGNLSCSISQLGGVSSVCFSNESSQCKSHLCPVACKENRDLQFGFSSFVANEFNEDKHGFIYGKPTPTSSPKNDILENFSLDNWLKDSSGMESYVEPLDPPSDLTGDYDSHLRNLLYAQHYHEVPLSSQVENYPHFPSSYLQYLDENPSDTVQASIPLQWDLYPQHNSNIKYVESYNNDFAMGSAPSIYMSNESKYRMDGLSTYFTNMKFSGDDKRLKSGNIRKETTREYNLARDTHKKAAASALPERCSVSSSQDHCSRPSLHRKSTVAQTHVNEMLSPSSGIQFGSFCGFPVIPSGSSQNLAPGTNLLQKLSPMWEDTEHERALDDSFRLKSEDDFPPLSTKNIGKKLACRD